MTGVVDPEITDRKRTVNDRLLRIKSERESISHDINEDSQTFRPQQFYQDLDTSLDGLAREIYVNELLKLCSYDYAKINDYRERLAERARGFPECPESRLVNRRNSSQASREKKCANDCYVIYAFLNGERSREIHDIFVHNEPITIDDDTDPRNANSDFTTPDVLAMLTTIQYEIVEISKRQAKDNKLLNELQTDVTQMALSFRTFHTTLNSILARTPVQPPTQQITKLQSDVSKLGSSIATMNKRFLDSTINERDPATNSNDQPTTNHKTYAEIVTSPPLLTRTDTAAINNVHDVSTSAINDADVEVYTAQRLTTENHGLDKEMNNNHITDTPDHIDTNHHRDTSSREQTKHKNKAAPAESGHVYQPTLNRFIAAKRRNVSSYFIGNIDRSVDESDIRDYLKTNDVKPTQLTMFYGKNGSSARINFYIEDQELIESSDFWPYGVTCRKWVNKQEWEKQRAENSRNRRTGYGRQRNRAQRSDRGHAYDNSEEDSYDRTHDRQRYTHNQYYKSPWEPEEIDW